MKIRVFFLLFVILSFFSCIKKNYQNIKIFYTEDDYNPYYESLVEGYRELNLTFSSPIIKLSDYDTMKKELNDILKIEISPEIEFDVNPVSDNLVNITFGSNLKPATIYKIRFNVDEIKSLDGKKVDIFINNYKIKGGEYYYYTTPFKVNSLYSTGKREKDPIIIEFNLPINYNELKENLSIIDQSTMVSADYKIEVEILTNTIIDNNEIIKKIYTNYFKAIIVPNLEKNKSYEVVVKKRMKALIGNQSLMNDYRYDFLTYGPLFIESVRSDDYDNVLSPDSSIKISYSNPIDEKSLKKDKIYIKPYVSNLSIEIYDNCVYLKGDFKGGENYSLKIDDDFVKDIYGQKIAKHFTKDLSFVYGYTYFGLPYGYMIMETYLKPILPFKIRNASGVKFKYLFISDINEIANILSKSKKERNEYLNNNGTEKKIDISWVWDKYYNLRLDLTSMKKEESGLMLYSAMPVAENPSSGNYERKGMILFTDMGITVKSSIYKSYIYLRNLKDNKPIEGADIYIYSNGQMVLCGKTSSKGIAEINNNGDYNPFIIAKKGNMITFNYGENNYYYESFYFEDEYYYAEKDKINTRTIYYGDSSSGKESVLYCASDRYLYKPGDTVKIKFIIRNRINDSWNIDNNFGFDNYTDISVYNSRGEKFTNFMIKFDEWGSAEAEIKIKGNYPTGSYYLEGTVNSNYYAYMGFLVEEYKEVKAELKIIPSKDYFEWGENFKCDIIGWYLFGAPVLKPINYSVYVSPYNYVSKKYDDYSFSKYESHGSERDVPFTLVKKVQMVDNNGKIEINKKLEKYNFYGDAIITVSATTELDDKSEVYGVKDNILLLNKYRAGIKTDKYFYKLNENVNASIIVIDNNEEIVKNKDVLLKVVKEYYRSYKKAGFGGRTYWYSELVRDVVQEKVVKAGKIVESIKINEPGYYKISAAVMSKGRLKESETSIYVVGNEYGWLINNDYSIELESDKKEYSVGETAQVLIKNPFKNATALVSIERDDVIKITEYEVKEGMMTIPVKIENNYEPNVYVSVMLFSGRVEKINVSNDVDYHRPSYRIGYINLPVRPKEKRLKVNIKTDKETYKPGETVRVNFEVLNNDNKGEYAELTVSVVDRGVLNLTGYKLIDPISIFYRMRPLGVYTSEMREYIYGLRYLSEKGEIIGGDGGVGGFRDDSFLRKNFKANAYYNSKLITLSNGKAEISFIAPDNLSSFKIMAIAQTKDSKFGSGDKDFSIKKPLMLLSTLPSFVRENDTINSGFILFNYTGKSGDIKVEFKTDFTNILTNVFLNDNSSKEILFNFRIPEDLTNINFEALAYIDKERDGFISSIPVYKFIDYEKIVIYDMITNETNFNIYVSDNVRVDKSYLTFSISPTLFNGITGSLDYLMNYPYDCLEQKISKVLPLIYDKNTLIRLNLLQHKNEKEIDNFIEEIIRSINDYFKNDGFSYYPESYADPYLTVYTTYALTLANKKGYSIDRNLFSGALNIVNNYAKGKISSSIYKYSSQYQYLVRSFALYVLALNDIKDFKLFEETILLMKKNNIKDLSSYVFLMKTAKLYGNIAENYLKEIFNIITENIRIEQSYAYINYDNKDRMFYYNNVIQTALVLQALLETSMESGYELRLMNYLKRSLRKDRYYNTHENVMVVLAMIDFAKKYEKNKIDYDYEIALNNKKIYNGNFKSYDDRFFITNIYLKDGITNLNIKLNKTGEGTLYYKTIYNYVLKELPQKRDIGFNIVKRYYDYDSGKEIKDFSFKKGKKYIVELEIFTYDDRCYVVVDDSIASGFEIVNFDFLTEQSDKSFSRNNLDYWGFCSVENYKDRIVFLSEYLYKGKYKLKYVIRAVNSGVFNISLTKAEEMYNPEVFGYIKNNNVIITE